MSKEEKQQAKDEARAAKAAKEGKEAAKAAREAKEAAKAAKASGKEAAPAAPKGPYVEPRLRKKYREQVVPQLREKFGITNIMAVPLLKKITLNMGFGKASKNKGMAESLTSELSLIAGQKAMICKAKVAAATWKLREGDTVGAKVTLRGERMWLFLEKLISVAVPRIRDFQGLSPKGFDRRGNYNMGLSEQSIFPDIDLDKVKEVQGMNISFTISGGNDDHSREMLVLLGMPLRKLPPKGEGEVKKHRRAPDKPADKGAEDKEAAAEAA
jgi:large subunit ribosomal protein L5